MHCDQSQMLSINGDHLEIKAKLRRAASNLQGKDTSYFSRAGDIEAIRLLYRLADQFTNALPEQTATPATKRVA